MYPTTRNDFKEFSPKKSKVKLQPILKNANRDSVNKSLNSIAQTLFEPLT